MKKYLLSGLVLGLASMSAHADYMAKPTANKGNNTAQFATMDLNSLVSAAQAGNPAAQFYLGTRVQKGIGVDKNIPLAFTLFKSAADKGLAAAQLNVGRMYADGIGVQRNEQLARQYFEKAASNGDNRASYNLAVMEEQRQNFVGAYQWYELSTRDGMLDNKVMKMSEGKKLALAANLSQEQIRIARDRADRWIQAQ